MIFTILNSYNASLYRRIANEALKNNNYQSAVDSYKISLIYKTDNQVKIELSNAQVLARSTQKYQRGLRALNKAQTKEDYSQAKEYFTKVLPNDIHYQSAQEKIILCEQKIAEIEAGQSRVGEEQKKEPEVAKNSQTQIENQKTEPSPNQNEEVTAEPQDSSNGEDTFTSSASIYNRIKIDSSFRDQVSRAIDLLKVYDNPSYQMINSEVNNIYERQDCLSEQRQRDIYLGSCNGSQVDSIIASLMVHEATHVYNVYVRGIYSYGTKEQELPAYQAELETARKVSAPQYFIDFIESNISYWESI